MYLVFHGRYRDIFRHAPGDPAFPISKGPPVRHAVQAVYGDGRARICLPGFQQLKDTLFRRQKELNCIKTDAIIVKAIHFFVSSVGKHKFCPMVKNGNS